MTVLIVDDQINVVSGIYFGVNWERAGVTKVLKAYTVSDAKEILSTQIVDIVLCDIEMPVENGLMLLRWIRKTHLQTECIILTSHADFLYAKEAMQLQSFDYILQPARYEELENSLLKAREKILQKRASSTLSSYGQLLFEERGHVLQALLREIFHSKTPDTAKLASYFDKFGIPITRETPTHIIMIKFFESEGRLRSWKEDLLLYAVCNILNELIEACDESVLAIRFTADEIIFLLYSPNGSKPSDELLCSQLRQFQSSMTRYFELKTACYFSADIMLNQLPEQLRKIRRAIQNNVAQNSGIFPLAEGNGNPRAPYPNEEWAGSLGTENPKQIFRNLRSRLDELEDRLDAEGLKRFYHDFMQALSNIADANSLTLSDMFDKPDLRELSLSAYRSVEEMRGLIDYAKQFFEAHLASVSDRKRQINKIVQYIRSHISEDIRRSDISNAVYLSPNYISRLFHSEMNISLKDYILTEKMNLARSLLQTTGLPISVIAVKVGYTNFSYFSQVYKRVIGNSPVAERCKDTPVSS